MKELFESGDQFCLRNAGSFPDNEQGHYQRQGILWQHEELCEAARDHIRSNAVVNGQPNMTAVSFCYWVNESLLPNSVLDPGYPRQICLETTCKGLHKLGFHVLDKKKGIYIDGHERDDVQHNKKFLCQMVASGFLLKDQAPNEEAKEAFPSDLESPTPERRAIVFFMTSQPLMPTMMNLYGGEHQSHKLSGQKRMGIGSTWIKLLR